MNRLERLYAVSEEIRRRSPTPVSASALAKRFGVSRRTMERDLSSLRNSGVALYGIEGRKGGQAILGTPAGRKLLSLSAEEITGLLMAVTASAPMPFGDAARAGAARLLDSLDPSSQVSVARLRERIRVGSVESVKASPGTGLPSQPPGDHQIMQVLEEAVRQERVAKIRYLDASGEGTSRLVEAVGFYRGGSSWFLIAWCRLRRDRRLFRIDRMHSASLTSERFAVRGVDETLGWVPGSTSQPG